MAGTSKAGATSAALTHDNVKDELDSSPRVSSEVKGKRVRAIPSVLGSAGGRSTTVVLYREDFKRLGLSHPQVEWDFRRDRFTVPVGDNSRKNVLSPEAAEILTRDFPQSFEYLDQSE